MSFFDDKNGFKIRNDRVDKLSKFNVGNQNSKIKFFFEIAKLI